MPKFLIAMLFFLCSAANCHAVIIWNTNIQDHKNDTVFELRYTRPILSTRMKRGCGKQLLP